MTTNILVCIATNFMTADQYMSIAIPGQMFKDVYRELNLHPKNLARLLEDSGTMTSAIVPWSTCGAFYYSTLGVSAFVYFPYCFMSFITPVITAVFAFTGISLAPLDKSKPIENTIDFFDDFDDWRVFICKNVKSNIFVRKELFLWKLKEKVCAFRTKLKQ